MGAHGALIKGNACCVEQLAKAAGAWRVPLNRCNNYALGYSAQEGTNNCDQLCTPCRTGLPGSSTTAFTSAQSVMDWSHRGSELRANTHTNTHTHTHTHTRTRERKDNEVGCSPGAAPLVSFLTLQSHTQHTHTTALTTDAKMAAVESDACSAARRLHYRVVRMPACSTQWLHLIF